MKVVVNHEETHGLLAKPKQKQTESRCYNVNGSDGPRKRSLLLFRCVSKTQNEIEREYFQTRRDSGHKYTGTRKD